MGRIRSLTVGLIVLSIAGLLDHPGGHEQPGMPGWLGVSGRLGMIGVAGGQEPNTSTNEAALAAYADAANFQANGAIPLAIEAWQKFLREYPESGLVSKASHYLGVCLMQQERPDHIAAAKSFAAAAADPKSDLREESLINLGWCQLAAAGEGEQRDKKRLRAALDAFVAVVKANPSGKYVDRALFYAGDAAYGLGELKTAIGLYDRLLALDSVNDSSLRCDALYARGIALEDAGRAVDAIKSYTQLLELCQDETLLADAKLRLGDANLAAQDYEQAIRWFAEIAAAAGPDRVYAIYRQAFALVQADRPAEAAALYERLVTEFPDSPYTSAATLASAQTTFRAGDLDEAAKRFRRVLKLDAPAAVTEATHWLATIALRQGQPERAAELAEARLAAGVAGPYAPAIKLDLAEALMLIPGKTTAAMDAYQQVYRSAPDAAEAPRALYNAAFAALQLGKSDQAQDWSSEFIDRFPEDALIADVRYILAESQLTSGDHEAAAAEYLRLVNDPVSQEKMQRPLWVLRAATALSLAGQNPAAIELLAANRDRFDPPQRAEAWFLSGTLELAEGRGGEAIKALESAAKVAPEWPRTDELLLQLGQAKLISGDRAAAAETWRELIERFPASRRIDQARFRLAQVVSNSGEYARAAQLFKEVLDSANDAKLIPASLYGRGWNLMRADRAAEALPLLDRLVNDHADHRLQGDARLAKGMCLRAVGELDQADRTLSAFLADGAEGVNRAHAVYELALIDQQRDRPTAAAQRLEQLVKIAPDYPDIDKVLYEWAWALHDSGEEAAAVLRFEELIERFPDNPMVAEAHYHVGQRRYADGSWETAAAAFAAAIRSTNEPELKEKSLYRLGWTRYKAEDYGRAREAFTELAESYPDGDFLADALLMIGESHFKTENFADALDAYRVARERIVTRDETAASLADEADRQIRELVLLHGGQSLSQLKQWDQARRWYRELQERFPDSEYLPQADYETAFALQQSGQEDEALKIYERVAAAQRNELGARSRFMMGEIHFGRGDFAEAIPQFQRVMYGYGADQATAAIRNWQAKSGFEAGRCAESISQQAPTPAARKKSAEIAAEFFGYVVDKHPRHALAPKSQERLEVLKRMGVDIDQRAKKPSSKSGS